PSRRTDPAVSASVLGSRPMMACAITVFPDPDSPTRHRSSPRATPNETPLTASARSAPGGSRTVSPLISSVLIEHQFWIERVPQPVAEHVDRQHRDREEHAREENVVRIG